MATFSVFDEDGRITQSNKVYASPETYGRALQDHGFEKFVETTHDGPVNTHTAFVRLGGLWNRPTMPVSVDRTRIKAGGTDVAVFSGVLSGTKVTVSTGGMEIGSDTPPSTFELPIPVPCVYQVRFEKWPYRSVTIEVIAE